MDSLYFMAMIVGIGWLAIWSAFPDNMTFASPFDMREAEGTPPTGEPVTPRAGQRAKGLVREASARPPGATGPNWRQRGRPGRMEATEVGLAIAEPRQTSSWRLRRDSPTAPRRRR